MHRPGLRQVGHQQSESQGANDVGWEMVAFVNARKIDDCCPDECRDAKFWVEPIDDGGETKEQHAMIAGKRIEMIERVGFDTDRQFEMQLRGMHRPKM